MRKWLIVAGLFISALSFMYVMPTQAAVPDYPSGEVAVHRFYNVKTLTHFYSPDENEVSSIRERLPDFKYEGIKFNAYSTPAPGRVAVHRFYNVKTLSHFYSSDSNEINIIRSTLKDFVYEGISYYTDESTTGASGKVIVYRFYNTKTLTHLYTSDLNEVNIIRTNLRDFSYEGAKFGASESRYFASCAAAEQAGFGKMLRGQVGYGKHLDSDGDGIACENNKIPVVEQPTYTISNVSPTVGSHISGQLITAGQVSPSNATVSYQWQKADAENGAFSDISGATTKGYTPVASDIGTYLRVVAAGTGSYNGTVSSQAQLVKGTLGSAGIGSTGNNSYYYYPNQALTAQVYPNGTNIIQQLDASNYTCQWKKSDNKDSGYVNIAGANTCSYTVQASDTSKYIQLTATGVNSYTGAVSFSSDMPVKEWGPQSYGAQSDCGTLCSSLVLTYTQPVESCTAYAVKEGSDGSQIPATATKSGSSECSFTFTVPNAGSYILHYSATTSNAGIVEKVSAQTSYRSFSSATTIESISDISGTPAVGESLSSGYLTPYNATATISWQIADTELGEYTDIEGAPYYSYNVQGKDNGKYIRLKAVGTGQFSGSTVYSKSVLISDASYNLTSVHSSYNLYNPTVGTQLFSGIVAPSAATVSYQWQTSTSKNGAYVNIDGATEQNYTIRQSDMNTFVRVAVTGTGKYKGTVYGMPTEGAVSDWGEVSGAGGAGPCEDGDGICGSFTVEFNVPITECSGGYSINSSNGTRYDFGPGEIENGNSCTYSYVITEPGVYDTYYYATTNADVNQQTRLFIGGLNQLYDF